MRLTSLAATKTEHRSRVAVVTAKTDGPRSGTPGPSAVEFDDLAVRRASRLPPPVWALRRFVPLAGSSYRLVCLEGAAMVAGVTWV